MGIEAFIYYIFLLDSVVANILAWFFPQWYAKTFKKISKYFPATKAWCFLYLLIMLWLGHGLNRLGIL